MTGVATMECGCEFYSDESTALLVRCAKHMDSIMRARRSGFGTGVRAMREAAIHAAEAVSLRWALTHSVAPTVANDVAEAIRALPDPELDA